MTRQQAWEYARATLNNSLSTEASTPTIHEHQTNLRECIETLNAAFTGQNIKELEAERALEQFDRIDHIMSIATKGSMPSINEDRHGVKGFIKDRIETLKQEK